MRRTLNVAARHLWLISVPLVVAAGDAGTLCAAPSRPGTSPAVRDLPAIRKSGVIRFCAQPAAMPHSRKGKNQAGVGIEIALAGLVAEKLNLRVELVWCSSRCARDRLRRGDCDVVLAMPVSTALGTGTATGATHRQASRSSGHSSSSSSIKYTVPYCGSYFALVVPDDDATTRNLDDVPAGGVVGVVRGSLPLASDRFRVGRFPSTAAVLDSVARRNLRAGVVEAAQAGWFCHRIGDLEVRIVDGYASPQRWNLAMGVSARASRLRAVLDEVLDELRGSGALQSTYARYGVRYHRPFTGAPARVVSTWKRIKRQGFFTVSLDPDNLPYSKRAGELPGIEVEFARAVAKELGLKAKIRWIHVLHETNLGKLLDGDCDVAMGLPVDPRLHEEDERAAEKILYTRPYSSTGYLLFVRKDGPRIASITELQGEQTRRIGAQAGSLADYLLKRRGYRRKLFGTQLGVLSALSKGRIDYAYLWSNATWLVRKHPELGVAVVQPYALEDRRDIAMAVRRDDKELCAQLNEALNRLAENGRVEELLSKYGVPFYSPGSGATARSTRGEGEPAISEPRSPTVALSRGRLTPNPLRKGVLRVGMDYKNPPLSYLKPKPGGLDYEIAKLLAEELGVGLEVFWARSSHGSYRSRLTGKRLFDVAVGVTADSRFRGKVLYSRPYYRAGYVVATSGSDAVSGPRVGIERGTAVPTPRNGDVRQYGSQLDVLRAVETGEVHRGWVATTKAGWLIRQDPDLKVTLALQEPITTWDVCLAVRKQDRLLKEQLEAALDRLESAGKLAPVFAKYGITRLAPVKAKEPEKNHRAEVDRPQ